MLKPAKPHVDSPGEPLVRRRKRRLRRIGMLPTLLTLGNLCFGLAAIHACGRELEDLGKGITAQAIMTWNSRFLEHMAPSYLSIGVWALIVAMICDGLDGRVARKTGQESKFGEQLDSLADVVSCGVAPALMMITMVRRELIQWGDVVPFGFDRFPQATVLIGIVYVCCTALRLARFNVEASLEQAAHEGFKGLPSPGACSALISLIFLHDHLDQTGGWRRTADFITYVLPLCTLSLALLMVSRVPFSHAVNLALRRRPFAHVIPVLLFFPLFFLYTKQMLVLATWAYVLAAVGRAGWQRLSGRHPVPEPDIDGQPGIEHSPSAKQAP